MAVYERISRRLFLTGFCRPMNHEIPGSVRGVTSLPVAALPASRLLHRPDLGRTLAEASSRPLPASDWLVVGKLLAGV